MHGLDVNNSNLLRDNYSFPLKLLFLWIWKTEEKDLKDFELEDWTRANTEYKAFSFHDTETNVIPL